MPGRCPRQNFQNARQIDLARAGVNPITAPPPLPDFPNFAVLQEQIVQQEKLINNLQINLENYREKIQTLQAQLRDEIAKPVSFRTTARSDAGSTLKEISENNNLTAMARKRKMDSKASCVFEELEEVAERHRESLASICMLREETRSKESPWANRGFNHRGKRSQQGGKSYPLRRNLLRIHALYGSARLGVALF